MNVIRIPTKFAKSIKRLSDTDRLTVFDFLLKIGEDECVNLPDTASGDLVQLIYGEWMNMESRNGTKPSINHISEGLGTNSPSDSGHRVEYSRVEENRVEENKIDEKKEIEVIKKYEVTDDTLATIPLLNNSFRKELIETIKRKETQKQTVTEMAIILFEDFGYQYQKDETFHSLRDWFVTLSNMHAKKGDEMGKVLFNWHTYWKGQKENKQPKDCKASFSKNPFLTSKFDKNENK